ncbi:MAG: TrmH family RNA methyltransferase, partial [Deltaproteobacteria bacterium]
EILSPPEVGTRLREHAGPNCLAAIVFGREDNGLTTDELSLCRWHATIPSADEYGSLNLAQSVMLFCYELCKAGAYPGGGRELTLAESAEMELLFDQMGECLLKIGFLNQQNPEHIMRSMRRIFFRAELDSREVAVLRGLMTQIEWACSDFDGRKRP